MKLASIFLLLSFSIPHPASAQTQSSQRPAPQPDRLGMTCMEILKMPSADWITYFNANSHAASPDGGSNLGRAIAAYGKCYDERTDRLAASLAKTGKGPLMGARGDFKDFETALKDFAAKALVDAQPPADSEKIAYANLYEKQFRYEFYQEYEAKTVKAVKPAAPISKTPAHATATPPAGTTSAAPAPAPATPEEQARSNSDPVTMAKNRFGKLLELLPDDKMHELHRAFGDVVGPYHISEAMRIAVYRYAIFILEPTSGRPFTPPPF